MCVCVCQLWIVEKKEQQQQNQKKKKKRKKKEKKKMFMGSERQWKRRKQTKPTLYTQFFLFGFRFLFEFLIFYM